VARLKEQLADRDQKLADLAKEIGKERELRIRADEQARTFEAQLREGGGAKDTYERVSRL